jgi:hypothetical protein
VCDLLAMREEKEERGHNERIRMRGEKIGMRG